MILGHITQCLLRLLWEFDTLLSIYIMNSCKVAIRNAEFAGHFAVKAI